MMHAIRKTSLVFGDDADAEEARVVGEHDSVSVCAVAPRRVDYISRCSLLVMLQRRVCEECCRHIHRTVSSRRDCADTMSVSTSPLRRLVQWTTTLLVST